MYTCWPIQLHFFRTDFEAFTPWALITRFESGNMDYSIFKDAKAVNHLLRAYNDSFASNDLPRAEQISHVAAQISAGWCKKPAESEYWQNERNISVSFSSFGSADSDLRSISGFQTVNNSDCPSLDVQDTKVPRNSPPSKLQPSSSLLDDFSSADTPTASAPSHPITVRPRHSRALVACNCVGCQSLASRGSNSTELEEGMIVTPAATDFTRIGDNSKASRTLSPDGKHHHRGAGNATSISGQVGSTTPVTDDLITLKTPSPNVGGWSVALEDAGDTGSPRRKGKKARNWFDFWTLFTPLWKTFYEFLLQALFSTNDFLLWSLYIDFVVPVCGIALAYSEEKWLMDSSLDGATSRKHIIVVLYIPDFYIALGVSSS